jgi:hypothetical protein
LPIAPDGVDELDEQAAKKNHTPKANARDRIPESSVP